MADEIIVLTGIKETLDALAKFDKSAVARFNKVINDELSAALTEAKASVPLDPPMSGWRKSDALKPTGTRGGRGWPGWDAGEIQKGITKTRSERRVRGDYTTNAGALKNTYSSGAIFEVVGRKKTPASTRSGQNFKNVIARRFGPASRLIWRVVDKDRARIEANVARALEEAKAELQKNLNGKQA
jgi:hypothetical protein